MEFNNNYCHSVKGKYNISTQCLNKPKTGSNLCGKHVNCKNIIYFNMNNINNINNINNLNEINNLEETFLEMPKKNKSFSKELLNTEENNEDNENNKKIYERLELYERIINNISTNIYSIRKSIKYCKLNTFINTKNSKQVLIADLKKFIAKERYYEANKVKVISVQSIIRKWLIRRRAVCSNDTDILTFICKYEIPSQFFYIFYDKITKKNFAYDIRTLLEIIHSDYSSCPYTFRKFTDDEKKNIIEYAKKLEEKNIIIKIEKPELNEKEEMEMRMKDVFHKINMLDNYTDHTWFKNLNINQLIGLYVIAEDIWNYRSNMTIEAKRRIVKDGIVFNLPINFIKAQKSVSKMQDILLTDFMRCITEGEDINEKKLGAILILTGLVEVSPSAAFALPHLIQI
jgi:hypothetical protein